MSTEPIDFVSSVISLLPVVYDDVMVRTGSVVDDIDYTIHLGTIDLNTGLATVPLTVPITDSDGTNDPEQGLSSGTPFQDQAFKNALNRVVLPYGTALSALSGITLVTVNGDNKTLSVGITEALGNLFLLTTDTGGTVQLSSDKISSWITESLKDNIFTTAQVGSICEQLVASGRFVEGVTNNYTTNFAAGDSIGCVVTLQANDDNNKMNILFKLEQQA